MGVCVGVGGGRACVCFGGNIILVMVSERQSVCGWVGGWEVWGRVSVCVLRWEHYIGQGEWIKE